MPSGRSWRPLFGIAALFGLTAPGCVWIPYCVPEFQRIGAIDLDAECDDVHVFRVDGEVKWRERFLNFPVVDEVFRLTRIDCVGAGTIDAQWQAGVDYGWLTVVPTSVDIFARRHRTMAVCLYRSGYETISIEASAQPHDLEWKPISDVVAQEHAVDKLLNGAGRWYTSWYTPGLSREEPLGGDFSAAHREALKFCAAEYERILRLVSDDDPEAGPTRERLKDKADLLRSLADVEVS